MKIKKRIWLFISLVLVVVFILWNILWLLFLDSTYKPLIDAVNNYEFSIAEDNCIYDGYSYNVFKPSYLSFSGNLSMSLYCEDEIENNETRCSLLIWPKLSGNYEYGVTLRVYKKDNDKEVFSFDIYAFLLDEKMNPIEKLDPLELEIYEKEKDVIKSMYMKAHYMWGIGEIM